ncbi:hypothetical protein E0Z10_g5105 [Xylaria hypoxylon]|uniref:Glycosyl transferase family 25 domain-containing protein n=1 Tax=Xylaria hypoxylon TaxID=37992 RepID=A0A4Z0YWU9_9PEZI|nr:hypothetical protein E0Z10_g5105 [Xylaria hypoxylon]
MLQHRRTLLFVFVALSLVYVCRLYYISQNHGSPSWVHRGRNDGDVLNSTLGFEGIFVINLPSRRDRRDAMAMAGDVSGLNLTFLEGLTGDSVPSPFSTGKSAGRGGTEAEPSGSASSGARGSWGSHMKALQTIVDMGLGSGLVLEDDVDWDVRLKTQMRTFAMTSRMWLDVEEQKRRMISRVQKHETTTSQRRGGRLMSWVPSWKGEQKQESKARSRVASNSGLDSKDGRAIIDHFGRDTIPLPTKLASIHEIHTKSPYGDDWDVLWLGHCGADLPATRQDSPSSEYPFSSSSSSLKISIYGDSTVPAPKHLKPHPFALRDKLADIYPAHTRVVHAANGNVCSLAYAVSQRGARKLLRQFGKDGFVYQWDLMLRDYCMGEFDGEREDSSEHGREKEGHISLVCLTVQPPLISHHYAGEEGGASVSDIRGQGGGLARGKKGTPYVRLSVQGNLERLVAGFPEDRLVDQLPDDGDTLW